MTSVYPVQAIDMATWPRHELFAFFNALDYPHFNLCATVDVTALHATIKRVRAPLTLAIVYVLASAANSIPGFRQRIHGQQVVEYAVIDPSMTIPAANDLFSFCTMSYHTRFGDFAANAAQAIERSRRAPSLSDDGREDIYFMSSIPWVSFTSLSHPIHLRPVDSVPRFTWGKISENQGALTMPVSVQVHHALMDGLHVGRFFERVQAALDAPEERLGV